MKMLTIQFKILKYESETWKRAYELNCLYTRIYFGKTILSVFI
jgi:hypothetical protein